MKTLLRTWVVTLLVFAVILYSCSYEDYQSLDDLSATGEVEYKDALDFIATLSPQQHENSKKLEIFFFQSNEGILGTILSLKMSQPVGVFSIIHSSRRLELPGFGGLIQRSIGQWSG